MTAGDLLVGLATLVLVFFTYRAVRVSRQSVEAADAPLLIGAHVPKDSTGLEEIINVHEGATPLAFEPPFAGLVPYEIKTTEGPRSVVVMRLWNVGRGPAVLKDVRLDLTEGDVLGTTASDVIVTPNGFSDQSWVNLTLPDDVNQTTRGGQLRILYEHPNGHLLQTLQNIEMQSGKLYFRTIKRKRAQRRLVRGRQ
jgi:hypothetical protein